MKKPTALLVTAMLLSGCSTSPSNAAQDSTGSAEAATTESSPSRSAQPSTSAIPRRSGTPSASVATTITGMEGLGPAETVYIGKLVQEHPRLREKSNDDLLGVGEVPCTLYDNGATMSEVNNYFAQASGVAYLLEEFAAIHGIGVAALCPEHMPKLGF